MSDTPRTDALWDPEVYDLMYRHAQQLERELAEARALLRQAEAFITGDVNLPCANGESDRECYNRCRAEFLQRVRKL